MLIINRLFWLFHFFVILATIAIVICTKLIEDQANLLNKLTGEIGPFELGSILLLILLSGIACFCLWKIYSKKINISKYHCLFIGIIGGTALLAALEESSWGQHFFKFESTQIFIQYNQQQETNLHNFIPAEIFGLTINASTYIVFVFIPLFLILTGNKYSQKGWYSEIIALIPSLHTIIIFCFGFSLQAYFKLATLTDTLALATALILLGYTLFFKNNLQYKHEKIHFCALLATVSVFLLSHSVFSYQNAQYEIREMIFIYGFLFWFSNYTYALISGIGNTSSSFISYKQND